MSETLELPNGDVVSPADVFCYNDYPYRLVWLDDDTHEFALSPLYWGDSGMDIPFRDRAALIDQWEADSRGLMSPAEWERWLDDAADDPRFGDAEVAALAEELPTPEGTVDGLRDTLGL